MSVEWIAFSINHLVVIVAVSVTLRRRVPPVKSRCRCLKMPQIKHVTCRTQRMQLHRHFFRKKSPPPGERNSRGRNLRVSVPFKFSSDRRRIFALKKFTNEIRNENRFVIFPSVFFVRKRSRLDRAETM